MPDFYLQEGQRFASAGEQTGISEGTELTASASTHTKGSYTQLLASTTFAASGLLVTLGGNSNTGSNFLTDVAIGGSGSEQVVLSNIPYLGSGDGTIFSFYVPVPIPSGSRIAARTQSQTGSAKHRIMCFPIAGGFQAHPGVSRVTTYGADTANSRGTDVTSSGSANTKGSWTQIVSATTAPMSWVVVLVYAVASQHLFDIGVGASSSEVAVVSNINIRQSPQETRVYMFPLRIAKGARISMRNAAASGSQTIRVVILGVG